MTLVSRTAFAKLLGVTTNAVKSWELSRDFGTCYSGDKVNLEKAVRWLYEWKLEAEESTHEEDPKSVKAYWDGKKAEATFKVMVGELVSKTDYINTEKERMSILKDGIMDIPNKIAPDLNLNEAQRNQVKVVCASVLELAQKTFKNRLKDWMEIINSKTDKESDE